MLTANQLTDNINKYATLTTTEFPEGVWVLIIDAKTAYGQVRYQIIPAAGPGGTGSWVQASRLRNIRTTQTA